MLPWYWNYWLFPPIVSELFGDFFKTGLLEISTGLKKGFLMKDKKQNIRYTVLYNTLIFMVKYFIYTCRFSNFSQHHSFYYSKKKIELRWDSCYFQFTILHLFHQNVLINVDLTFISVCNFSCFFALLNQCILCITEQWDLLQTVALVLLWPLWSSSSAYRLSHYCSAP